MQEENNTHITPKDPATSGNNVDVAATCESSPEQGSDVAATRESSLEQGSDVAATRESSPEQRSDVAATIESSPEQGSEGKTPKKGRRILKVLGILTLVMGIIVLLLGGCVKILQLPKVQTYLIGKLTHNLSETLNADVHIKHIYYRPLNHLTIDSLYISDQQRDTLAFIEKTYINIDFLAFADDRLDFTAIELERPYIRLQSLNDSTLNCDFLFTKQQQPNAIVLPRVNIDQLTLTDLRFRYNQYLVSELNLSLHMPVFTSDSLDIQLEELSLDATIDNVNVNLHTRLHGNLDSIYADEILLDYQKRRIFTGDIAIYHPTQLDSLYIEAHCTDLHTSYHSLQEVLQQLNISPTVLPQEVARLGNIHYRGAINGRLEHTDLHGILTTALGAVQVNGYVEADTTLQDIDFCGHLATDSFQLGTFLSNKDIGTIALHAHLDGEIDSAQLTTCTAEAKIQCMEYRGYPYQDIDLNGTIGVEEGKGTLVIRDENISLELNGLAVWAEKEKVLDINARIQDFKPYALRLTDQYPDLSLSAMTYISLFSSGTREQILDNLFGYVIVDTLAIQNGDKHATMEQLKLDIESDWQDHKPYHKLHLQSDYLTADISGNFRYHTLPQTYQQFVHTYLPSLVAAPTKPNKQANQLNFYAYFRELNEMTQVLGLPMSFPSYPTIKGFIDEETEQIGLQAHIPHIQTAGTQIDNLTVALDNHQDSLDIAVYMYNRLPKHNPTAAKIGDVKARILLNALNDDVDMRILLENTDSIRNEGTIHISSHVSQENNQPQLTAHIHPTQIVLNDSAWTINDALIHYSAATKKVEVNHFGLSTDYQSIGAHGTASPNAEDSIQIDLQNINVQYLLGYTLAGEAISVQGPLTGWATLYGLFTQPMVEAQVAIPQAGLNGSYLGDLTANAYLDREEKTIIIEGEAIDSTDHQVVEVKGKVIPADKWWGLNIHCDSVDIGLIDFWTHTFFSNPKGRAFGDLQVFGQERQTWVTTAMYAKDAELTVPQIGATFYFSDSIYMDSTAIRIPRVHLRDAEGNRGVFSGAITHNNFQDFHYDLNAEVDNLLALNLPYDPQAMFYGRVYGSGNVNIKGDDYVCRIGVNARTEANSKFYLSVNTASTASNASFIQFAQPDTTSHSLLNLLNTPTEPVATVAKKQAKLLLSLQLEATPTADIHISLGGDNGIRGRGEGNLKITYDDSTEDVQMLGTYTLQSGIFSYSLGNIVRRSFDIAEGSSVTWSGDALAPTVDITGRYHTTASLRDLFGSEISQAATNRTSIPVNCVLHLTEQLFNPKLSFSIELPQSDESIQSQVNSIINTDEMLMRQVLYLLVFNRFYTADYLQNTQQSVGLNETYSLLSSTITNQVNSWLSKLTDVFTMGFNFRTDGEGETASQEYEANFQIQPIRQLVINGNFGYRYNDLSNRPFFGDLDIEYLLTQNGKLRAKAYTHTVDKYSLRQANTVQGLGLVFKHDFNWKRKDKNNQTKEKKQKRKKANENNNAKKIE